MVTLGPPQQIRDQPVTTLTIHPARVNPVTNQLEIIHFLSLKITFDQSAASVVTGPSAPDSFDQALSATLLNPEAVQ